MFTICAFDNGRSKYLKRTALVEQKPMYCIQYDIQKMNLYDYKNSPLWQPISGAPENPGRQRQTKNACSRIHSEFLPHPSVLQSVLVVLSDVPKI